MDPRRRRQSTTQDDHSPLTPPLAGDDVQEGNSPTSPPSQAVLPEALVTAAEWLCSFCHQELINQRTPEAIAARAFLQMQGLAWSAIEELPIGILADASALRTTYGSKALGPIESIDYWLNDARLNRVLVGPIRDADGSLVTLWARSIDRRHPSLLYRHCWQDRIAIYGRELLSTVRPEPVFVVEKILDVLVLRSHGIQPAVAFGRRFDEVPAETWAALCSEIASSIVLIPAGMNVPASVFRAVRVHVQRLINPPEIWVLPPKRMFGPLGRMAAVLKAQEFVEYVRHRGVALLGRKRVIQLVKGGGLTDAHHPCQQERSSGLPTHSLPTQNMAKRSDGPESKQPKAPDRFPNADWLAFD